MHVPHMAPRPMTQVMAQPCDSDKIDVVVRDPQPRLLSLQIPNLLLRKVRDTCQYVQWDAVHAGRASRAGHCVREHAAVGRDTFVVRTEAVLKAIV